MVYVYVHGVRVILFFVITPEITCPSQFSYGIDDLLNQFVVCTVLGFPSRDIVRLEFRANGFIHQIDASINQVYKITNFKSKLTPGSDVLALYNDGEVDLGCFMHGTVSSVGQSGIWVQFTGGSEVLCPFEEICAVKYRKNHLSSTAHSNFSVADRHSIFLMEAIYIRVKKEYENLKADYSFLESKYISSESSLEKLNQKRPS